MRPSVRYRQDAQSLHTFREAFVDLLNHAKSTQEDMYSLMHLEAAVDNATWQRMRSEVASASGPASAAYARYGGLLSLRNPAYVMSNVNPVQNWELSLRDPEQMPPERVIAAVEAARALAGQEAADAARRERGLTGLIAAFLRWPSDLREAVGPQHPGQRKAAGLVGHFLQVLVGALATSAAGGIVVGVIALWKLVL